MWRDLKHAAHSLRRSGVFTVSATVALGLAIGANAAIFGLVDGLWLRPPGVPRPSELVRVLATTSTGTSGVWSFPEYLDFERRVGSFSGVVARGSRGALLDDGGEAPELLLANVVSTNFFSALGVAAAHGRLFAMGDDAALEAQPGVVLGHACWRRRFGADPSIVGRSISLGRTGEIPVIVLGVLPATFRDLDAAGDRDLWLPTATWARLAGRDDIERRQNRYFNVVARRRAGVSVEAASDETAAVAASFARDYPEISTGRGALVISDLRYRLQAAGVNAVALVGLVLLVVLITCVNLANLLLSRAAARAQEIATRVALGAGRWRLMRLMLAESLLIGALGTAAGLAVASWLVELLPSFLVPPPGFPSLLLFQVDGRVLAFTLGVALLTTMLFGIVPSWLAARGDLVSVIKGSSALGGSRRLDRFAGEILVVGQIAVSLVLLSTAGVLARSFVETQRADLGFARKPMLTAWGSAGDVPAAVAAEAAARLEALPGVTRVAVAIRAPLSLSGGGLAQAVFVPDRPPQPGEGLPQVKFTAVSSHYFETLGVPIRRGRGFTAADDRPGEPVIVVNEQFARRFFPGADPIDRTVRLGGERGPTHRIVGVVQNTVIGQIGEEAQPYFYLPYWRGRYGDITYLVEHGGTATGLATAVRAALTATHPSLEPRRVITMSQYIEYSASTYQATAALSVSLGVLGLILTAVGVYGVVAYRTSRRTREIGVRVALGAAPGQVVSLVLGDGVRLVLWGIAVGVPAALAFTHMVESMVFGVSAWDPFAFAVAAGVLAFTVILATFVPARRAARVNPSTALRM